MGDRAKPGSAWIFSSGGEALSGAGSVLAGLLDLVENAVFVLETDGTIAAANVTGAAIVSRETDELIGEEVAKLLPLVDLDTGRRVLPLDASIPNGLLVGIEAQPGEFRLEWRVVPRAGSQPATIISLSDETSARAMDAALRARETFDAVTGALNREQFEARVDVALATARGEEGARDVLCHLDLDHSRLINDTAGPEAGDKLLCELASAISALIRPSDAIGRIGDNAFGLLFENAGVVRGAILAQQAMTAICERGFVWEGRRLETSASVGLVAIGESSPPARELMRRARIACLQAKLEGRGKVVVASDAPDASKHMRQLSIAGTIKDALSMGRMSLSAQAIVDLTGHATQHRHFELLLRSVDAEGRPVAVEELIGAAERFDMMRAVDRWVLGEALDRFGPRVAAEPGLSISINLSGSSLGDPGFLPHLLRVVDGSPVLPEALTFELTETAVLMHHASALRTIATLRERGCQIALDDFGVGLSNFEYLQRFPVDVVKIDGSFVRHLFHRPRDATILEAMIDLVHRLGAKAVVEHVESAALLERVAQLGADFAQGFFLGRPRSFAAILDDLAQERTARTAIARPAADTPGDVLRR